MRFLVWLATNAIALAVAAMLFDGIGFTGASSGQAEIEEKILPLLAFALILGVVTAVVKPVVTFLSIPAIILTLGLFLLVVNAAMLLLSGWIAEQLDIGFRVDGFWTAVGGSVVITVVTWVIDALIRRRD